MCARTRLNREERKEEILRAGLKVFKEKGFVHSSMEDIIAATTLSKGGVYHYYKSTTDILHNLMYLGIDYRMNIIKDGSREASQTEDMADFMAEKMIEKIVDENLYMDIYVQFLIAKRNNKKLEGLFEELKEKTREEFKQDISDIPESFINDAAYDFITDFINAMIIGAEVLGGRENFIKNKKVLKEAMKILIEKL